MKLNDITPQNFICHTNNCCPAVLETETGSLVIIGKKLSAQAAALVAGRVGADEYVIEIDRGMLANVK